MTVSNIEKLVKKYPEDLLIKGLNFAIQEINYEIKSLSYLEKTIDTGIENSKKKIIVGSSPQNNPSKPVENKENSETKNNETPKGSDVDSKAIISPVEEFKWCMKNKKYP